MKRTLYREGTFYKGNLHCHTTRSDGRTAPQAQIAAYKARGYRFLCITDHNIYTRLTGFDSDDFLLLPGMEINAPPQAGNSTEYHILVLPGTRALRAAATKEPFRHDDRLELQALHTREYLQQLLDDAHARGNLLCVNHPAWSRVEYDQILALNHVFALEIFNFCSSVIENVGESTACWDGVLRNGKRLWGLATDDTHNFYPCHHGGNDAFGGFIVVKAREFTAEGIMEAVADGSFYASAGPEIKDFYVEDGRAHLLTAPMDRLYISGDARQYAWKLRGSGEPLLTEFVHTLRGDETYVRGECYDEEGRKAYTNPIWLT